MRIWAVSWVLCRDHVRRGDVLLGAVAAALVIGLFLNPRQGPYDRSYVGTVCAVAACVAPALAAATLSARAAGVRADTFLLGAGRVRYYLGVVVAALVVGVFWMALLGSILPFLGVESGWGVLRQLAAGVLLNTLLVVATFCLFSSLCGSSAESLVAVMLVILGLSTSWFADLPRPELRYLALLVPPLLENARAAGGALAPETARSLLYAGALVVLGLLRFRRREFYWA